MKLANPSKDGDAKPFAGCYRGEARRKKESGGYGPKVPVIFLITGSRVAGLPKQRV